MRTDLPIEAWCRVAHHGDATDGGERVMRVLAVTWATPVPGLVIVPHPLLFDDRTAQFTLDGERKVERLRIGSASGFAIAHDESGYLITDQAFASVARAREAALTYRGAAPWTRTMGDVHAWLDADTATRLDLRDRWRRESLVPEIDRVHSLI